MFLIALSTQAHAFCGTYVSSGDSDLENTSAEVAIVRDGTRTTLNLSNDVIGDTSDFALILPVPEVLGEDDIHVLDHGVFSRLREYTGPRLVSYECDDFVVHDEESDTDTDADSDGDTDTGVVVEAEYVVGEYEIVILSASQSASLGTWLDNHDYKAPQDSEGILQSYIDAGSYFFAAKVDSDDAIPSGGVLSPLQLSYDSEAYSLPIRLGTLNSPGSQDLVVYALNPSSEGSVGISNYSELSLEDECLFQATDDEDFAGFYARQVDEAYASTEAAGWIQEYAWGSGACDPCPPEMPDETDFVSLGMDFGGDYADLFVTRLRMRYSPEQATQDLSLYNTGIRSSEQLRWIEYAYELEDRWPICGEGTPDDPGSCETQEDSGSSPADPPVVEAEPKRSCSAVEGGGLGLLALAGLLGLWRRREA
jgi:MYXO-CTERM domain-containing protein